MGIKSTRTLKRSEALEMLEDLREQLFGVKPITNEELGDLLETFQDLNCERNGRTNFDNYRVVDDAAYEDIVRDWEKY